ncbi:MAG: extracellular solute-binding protein [Eubacteriales bacterium]|nr:extracellular solute-binding protein [Eubacteriales bacterium]
MKKKQIMSVLLCGAMAVTTFAATGISAQAADKKELTYWSMWNSTENQAKVIQEAADAYEEATGVHVNIEWKGRDVKTMIGAALDAGENVDLFDDDFQRVVEQDGKYLVDLTEMAAAVDYESHIMPIILDQAKAWGDGKLLVMPYQPYTTGVWYNKDLWEQAGLTDEDVPETWDALLAACKKVKEGDSGLNAMTCDSNFVNLLYGFQLARYVGQDKVMDIINNADWVNVPEAKQAAEDIQTLFSEGYMSEYAPANGTDGQSEVGYGESIMVLQASWVPNEIIQTTGTEVNWGFFPWPTVEGGVDGTEGSMVGAQGFGIVAKSEMQQEAFDFAHSICTGEYDLKMAESVNSIPADTDNTEWPAAIQGAEPFFKNVSKAYMWAVGFQTNTDYMEIIQEHLIKLAKVEETPDEFVEALSAAKK